MSTGTLLVSVGTVPQSHTGNADSQKAHTVLNAKRERKATERKKKKTRSSNENVRREEEKERLQEKNEMEVSGDK